MPEGVNAFGPDLYPVPQREDARGAAATPFGHNGVVALTIHAALADEFLQQLAESIRGDNDFFAVTKSLGHLLYLYVHDHVLQTAGRSDLAALVLETYTRGMVNVPLTDAVRFRLNAFYQDQKPLFTNLSGEPAPLGQKSYGANAKLAFDLSSAISFTIDGTFAHTDSSANQDVPIGAPVIGVLQEGLTGIGYGRGITTVNQNTPAQDIFETKRLAGTFLWKAGAVEGQHFGAEGGRRGHGRKGRGGEESGARRAVSAAQAGTRSDRDRHGTSPQLRRAVP